MPSLKHKDCDGYFEPWEIREHNYSFMKCGVCGHYLFDGPDEKTKKKVERLMRTKVLPTVRRTN